jgi:parallel beta-helix repeat protein
MANPTIGATTPRIQYTATSSQTVFTVPFEFLANADLAVYVNGTLKTLTTDYTLTGANTTGGGTLTFVTGRTAGEIVTILGNLAYSRNTNKYTKFGLLPAEVLEADFDALQVQAKQLALADQFAIRAPLTDTGSPAMTLPVVATRASKVLGFDASGNPTASSSTVTAMDAAVTAINTIAGAAAGSSGSISHIASGTGATTTTVQAKLRETVSVKDFGATGDGTTNDAAAIQAAIDAAGNNATVVFPAGTYCVGSAGLAITSKTGVTLLGQGAKIKLTAISSLTISGFGATSIKFASCTRSGIRGIEVDGNSIATHGIGLSACTDCFIDGVTIYSCGSAGMIISAGGGLRNRFINNTVYSAIGTSRGMWLGNVNSTDMESDIFVSGNTVRNNPASGIVVSAVGGRVIANHSRTNEGAGIVLPGANGYSSKNLTISGNYCVDNLFHGIQSDVIRTTDADLTADITVTGNVCSSHNRGTGSGIYAINCQRWTVSNNVCNDNKIAGIQLDDRARNITVVGNTCGDTRSGGSRTQDIGIRCNAQAVSNYGVSITGNTCSNNISNGISISTVTPYTLTNVAINGNTCYANSSSGIFAAEAALGEMVNFVVSGNACLNNTTVDLRLSLRDVAIGPNRYSTEQNAQYFDLASNSATPDVPGRTFWRADNSSATTITAFNSGVDGQQIIIRASNANTTVQHGGLIINKGAVNAAIPSNGIISYTKQGTVWFETFRSF